MTAPRRPKTCRLAVRRELERRYDGPWPAEAEAVVRHGSCDRAWAATLTGRARTLARMAADTRRALARIRVCGPLIDLDHLVRRLGAYRSEAVACLEAC